jgi:PAS domain S-box-containing protein
MQLSASDQQLRAAIEQLEAGNRQLVASDAELRAAKDFLEKVFRTCPDGIIVTDFQGIIQRVNQAVETMLGYCQEELIGRHMAELTVPDAEHMAVAADMMGIMRLDGFVENYEAHVLKKDGTICTAEFSGTYMHDEAGAVKGAIGTLRDITERKKIELALQESEQRFRTIAELSPDAIFTTDDTFRIIFWNAAAEKIFGYAPHEILGKSAEMLMPTGRKGVHAQRRDALLANNSSPAKGSIIEAVALRTGQIEFPVEVSLTTWAVNGRTFYSMILRDITARKQAEQALKENKEFIESIFRASPDIIIMLDAEGRIVLVNNALKDILGYTPEEVSGQFVKMLAPVNEDEQKPLLDMMAELFEQGVVKNHETLWRRKDGTPCFIECNAIMLKDAAGDFAGSIAVLRDISDRKKAEHQLRQSQKMEAIGTLAGGIAHDFNNILSAIIGFTEMNYYDPGNAAKIKRNSEQVLKASKRAKELVKQILTYSRQAEQEKRPLRIKAIINEAIKLLRASIPTTIQIQPSLKSDPVILADATQIHQILINLCSNATHAMEEAGGVLEISLDDTTIAPGSQSQALDLPAGSFALVEIRDTGCGIAPDLLSRIFDPFFTTKQPGKGTGMGLSVVHGIVTSHGGAIQVSSRPGHGSTFRVYLPRIKEPVEESQLQVQPLPHGSERLLFIDDEESLAQVGQEMLESLGYSVASRTGSAEALELFRSDPGSFDLVITDYTMPGLNGCELAREILRIRPDVPVILCTGFSEQISSEKALGLGLTAFLMKPFSRKEIAELVRSVLDQKV